MEGGDMNVHGGLMPLVRMSRLFNPVPEKAGSKQHIYVHIITHSYLKIWSSIENALNRINSCSTVCQHNFVQFFSQYCACLRIKLMRDFLSEFHNSPADQYRHCYFKFWYCTYSSSVRRKLCVS